MNIFEYDLTCHKIFFIIILFVMFWAHFDVLISPCVISALVKVQYGLNIAESTIKSTNY